MAQTNSSPSVLLTKSRIAKQPVLVPSAVQVDLAGGAIKVKGKNGELSMPIHRDVLVVHDGAEIKFEPRIQSKSAKALAGTARALVNNMVTGVNTGYQKELTLVGVGYRAQVQGKVLNLSLGFSHPINFDVPEGITITTPSLTQVIVSGANKQLVGETAARIRAIRPPEPYKGKGVRYANETVITKETKKKK